MECQNKYIFVAWKFAKQINYCITKFLKLKYCKDNWQKSSDLWNLLILYIYKNYQLKLYWNI